MALADDGGTVRRTDVVHRTPEEILTDERQAARRTVAAYRMALVTLLWLVSVPLLIGWELTGTAGSAPVRLFDEPSLVDPMAPQRHHGGPAYVVAAVLAVLLPFVAGVIATKSQRYFLGGAYVVLTLAMVLPALSIARAAG